MKKMKIVSIVAALAILLSMFSILCVPASAATTKTYGNYNCKKTVSFTVKTDKNAKSSINFVCNGNYYKNRFGSHQCKAPRMVITVSPAVNGKTVFYIQDSGLFGVKNKDKISSTLKLDKNKTYKIKVSYLYNSKYNSCKDNEFCIGHENETSSNNEPISFQYWRNGTWNMTGNNVKISNIK